MLKSVFLIVVGAAGALEGERLFASLKARYRPSALTTKLFDTLNEKLEENRSEGSSGDPTTH